MKARVLLREAARRDLEEQVDFLARTAPQTALRFVDAVEAAFSRLARNPRVGHRQALKDPLLREVRHWPVPGFDTLLVFYRPVRGGIDVLRLLHGAGDLPRILEDDAH